MNCLHGLVMKITKIYRSFKKSVYFIRQQAEAEDCQCRFAKEFHKLSQKRRYVYTDTEIIKLICEEAHPSILRLLSQVTLVIHAFFFEGGRGGGIFPLL